MEVKVPAPEWWRRFGDWVGLDKGDVLAVFLLLTPIWFIFFARPWPMAFALLVVLLLNDAARQQTLDLRWRGAALTVFVAALIGASSLWSLVPTRSVAAAGEVIAYGLTVWLLTSSVRNLQKSEIKKVGSALVIAVWGMIGLLAIEYATELSTSRWLLAQLGLKTPSWAPWLNKPTLYMVLFSLTALWWLFAERRFGHAAALLVATITIVWMSSSGTAKLALAIGVLCILLLRVPLQGRHSIVGLGLLMIVFAGPLIIAIKHTSPSTYSLLENRTFSTNHRLLIWQYAESEFAKRPWIGIGAAASRALPGAKTALNLTLKNRKTGQVAARSNVQLLPVHPHSAGWELLLELGVLGILLLIPVVFGLVLYGSPLSSVVVSSAYLVNAAAGHSVWNTDITSVFVIATVAAYAIADTIKSEAKLGGR